MKIILRIMFLGFHTIFYFLLKNITILFLLRFQILDKSNCTLRLSSINLNMT